MTACELQVTQHIFDDSKTECIAETLGISVYTVNTYVQRLYLKLNVRGRSQLVLCVMKAHLEHLSIARESQVRAGICPTAVNHTWNQ
jgi:DNA-binding NarL/FixJ family response regulator